MTLALRDRVVRVSLRSDADGVLEERGTIEQIHRLAGTEDEPFGYTVLWDALPPRFPAPRAQYVSPIRIVSEAEFAAVRKTAAGGAA